MRDLPLLFTGPMVRSVLDGRKTQTRRIKHSAEVGDTLWVRETWGTIQACDHMKPRDVPVNSAVGYLATQDIMTWCQTGCDGAAGKWRPSIFMPRWASRISLRVTAVRMERLQDISEEDAKAEGLSTLTKDGGRLFKWGIPDRDGLPGNDDDGWPWHEWEVDPRKAYRKLWDSINAARGHGWDTNPLVKVITSERITP